MKAIKVRIQKTSRPGVIFLATVVAIITSMVVANATQTITTPNAAFISYNLAANANSAPITPAASRAVLVMGCCTTNAPGQFSVAQVTLQHAPGVGMLWVGLEATPNASITQGGVSSAAGTHIVYLDSFHVLDIQVASADTIRIHNGYSATRAGNVTLIW
jgi:hypothetical protein